MYKRLFILYKSGFDIGDGIGGIILNILVWILQL
jgi:hypothetical protein